MKIKKIKLIFPFLVLLLFMSCNGIISNEIPEISSFSIPSEDIVGQIDNGVIRLTVPNGFDFSTELVPEIVVTNGGTVTPASGVAQDFSINPMTYTAYSNNGEQSVYNVVVKEAVIQAAAGAVYISEVFNGAKSDSSTGVQVNNSYIELYNASDISLDLSQFSLKLNDSDTSDNKNLDFEVELIGTIAANSTFVIYNKDIDSTVLNSISKDGVSDISDLYLNGITNSDGNDYLELFHNGVLVDLFKPADGKEGYNNYADMKKFVKKGGKSTSTVWSDNDWILYGVGGLTTDDDSVGMHDAEVNAEAMNITYFAFELGFSEPVVGIIDNANKTVSVTLPEGTDRTALVPVFGFSGNKITSSSVTQENAVTAHDFSKDIVYTVWANNGGTKKYTVTVGEFSYTTENYDFNGNIKTVLDAIIAGDSAVTSLSGLKDPEYTGAAGTITGVVTAKDVYGHSTAKKCYFLQDKDAGIYIFTSEGLDASVALGTKITLTVTQGKVYFEMPEVTGIGSYTVVERNIPIYYQTGDYSSADSIGKVFLYEGAIELAMDGNSVGKFKDDLYFHSSNTFSEALAVGITGKFYGPVTFSYDLYRMEINSSLQISE